MAPPSCAMSGPRSAACPLASPVRSERGPIAPRSVAATARHCGTRSDPRPRPPFRLACGGRPRRLARFTPHVHMRRARHRKGASLGLSGVNQVNLARPTDQTCESSCLTGMRCRMCTPHENPAREADQRRIRPPKRLVLLGAGASGTVTRSWPNDAAASFSKRSAGIERGAPRTMGTPSLTAFR